MIIVSDTSPVNYLILIGKSIRSMSFTGESSYVVFLRELQAAETAPHV